MANNAEKWIEDKLLLHLKQAIENKSMPEEFRKSYKWVAAFVELDRKEWSDEPQLKPIERYYHTREEKIAKGYLEPIDVLKDEWTLGEVTQKLNELSLAYNQLIKERK